jgi:hypothetical protein
VRGAGVRGAGERGVTVSKVFIKLNDSDDEEEEEEDEDEDDIIPLISVRRRLR